MNSSALKQTQSSTLSPLCPRGIFCDRNWTGCPYRHPLLDDGPLKEPSLSKQKS